MTRIGDEDRDRVVRLLSEQVGAGRLSLAEFDQRAARAYAARTREDLDTLVADLPVTPPPDTAPAKPTGGRAMVLAAGLGVLAVALLAVGVSAVSPVLLAAVVCGVLACMHRTRRAPSQGASHPTTRGCC